MVKKTIIAVIMVASLLITSASIWLYYYPMPIMASPEDMTLANSDIPGWTASGMACGFSCIGDPPEPMSIETAGYSNQSTAYSLSITFLPFKSSYDSHEFYSALDVHYGLNNDKFQILNRSVNQVNEQIIVNYSMMVQNPCN